MSGKLFQAAAAAGHLGVGGAPTTAEVIKGLDSLNGDTLDGLAPPLTYTAGKPHPVDCWYYAGVEGRQVHHPVRPQGLLRRQVATLELRSLASHP